MSWDEVATPTTLLLLVSLIRMAGFQCVPLTHASSHTLHGPHPNSMTLASMGQRILCCHFPRFLSHSRARDTCCYPTLQSNSGKLSDRYKMTHQMTCASPLIHICAPQHPIVSLSTQCLVLPFRDFTVQEAWVQILGQPDNQKEVHWSHLPAWGRK